MKTTKKMMLFVATLFVATFALSSCLNDDNETKVPTVEEQRVRKSTGTGAKYTSQDYVANYIQEMLAQNGQV